MSLDDLDHIKSMMGACEVSADDTLQVCLRNGCRSVTPIRYAHKFIASFNLQAFTVQLLDALLNQPYRGIMLRELDRLFSGAKASVRFHQLLSAAVEKQGEYKSAA